jgi:hypothetical protein
VILECCLALVMDAAGGCAGDCKGMCRRVVVGVFGAWVCGNYYAGGG